MWVCVCVCVRACVRAIIVVYLHIYSAPPLPSHTPSAPAARGVQWRRRSERTLAPSRLRGKRRRRGGNAEEGGVWKRAETACKH
jgi:hypothetical protein